MIFSNHSFIGRISKLNNRYWLEIEHFFSNHTSTTSSDTPYHDTKSQTRLSCFEIFPENKMFCNKPTPLYINQYLDLFITYKEGFNMHTGNQNPLQLHQNEQYNQLTTQLISGKLIHTQDKFLFPALLISLALLITKLILTPKMIILLTTYLKYVCRRTQYHSYYL